MNFINQARGFYLEDGKMIGISSNKVMACKINKKCKCIKCYCACCKKWHCDTSKNCICQKNNLFLK